MHIYLLYKTKMDIESWQTQLRKGAAELALLAALEQRPAYGLQLLHAVNRHGTLVTEGGLYPLLGRLERSGRIAADWRPAEGGGDAGGAQPRKYYRLTDEGRRLAGEMRARWAAFHTTINTLLEDDDGTGA